MPVVGSFEERGFRDLTVIVRGLLVATAAACTAIVIASVTEPLSPLVVSIALGAVVASSGVVSDAWWPGLRFAGRRVLRLGIVLLGFRLGIDEVIELGAPALTVVAAVVTATFFGTWWLGRRLGLTNGLSLLVASGFAICGASAVAAMQGVVEAEDDEVASAVILVTLCGTLAVFALPALNSIAMFDAATFGAWAGASVHDVGQVIATAAPVGTTALHAAIVVKLVRVVLLAPLVATASAVRRAASAYPPNVRRPPIVPLFVVGFLAAMVVRSTGLLQPAWLDGIRSVEVLLLSTALFGLGTGANLRDLRHLGAAPLLLAGTAWILVAGVSFVGVLLVS